MKKLRLGYSALSNKVYAGHVSKDGKRWLEGKQDVTDDFIAIIAAEFLRDKDGKCCSRDIIINGEPKYTVTLTPYKPEGK